MQRDPFLQFSGIHSSWQALFWQVRSAQHVKFPESGSSSGTHSQVCSSESAAGRATRRAPLFEDSAHSTASMCAEMEGISEDMGGGRPVVPIIITAYLYELL